MKDNFRKIFVMELIILFLGTSVLSGINGSYVEVKDGIINKEVETISIFSNAIWKWIKQGGGNYTDSGNDIYVDDNGNTYTIGTYSGSATFDSIILTSNGEKDIFVAKMDSNGNFLWVQNAGGIKSDEGHGISLDNNGNSYITGYFHTMASFGNITLTSDGGYWDVFVAKLDSNGNWLWAIRGGGNELEESNAICVDSAGNLYIIGYFYGTATFGNTTLINQGGERDIFVAKLDSNGNWLWAKGVGGEYSWFNDGIDISVDSNGCPYVTGYFHSKISFGSIILKAKGLVDIFVAKLDTNGNWLWAKGAGGEDWDEGNSIYSDSAGNSYITGHIDGTASFDDIIITNDLGIEVFIAKLDTDGNWLWAKNGEGFAVGYGIFVDPAGNSYITGDFGDSASFGNSTIIGKGDFEIFVAKMDPVGNWLWAKSAGSVGHDEGFDICVDSNGNLYLTGYFAGRAYFDSIVLTSRGDFDVFIAKLEQIDNNPPNAPKITGTTIGESKIEYTYTFNAIDPDDDQIKLTVNWDDGKTDSTSFTSSGEDIEISHTWFINETYTIMAKAEDTNGLVSLWTELNVTIGKSKTINRPLLKFTQYHPNIFPILRFLFNSNLPKLKYF